MRVVIAFALGMIVGAPLLAVATAGWLPAKLSWNAPREKKIAPSPMAGMKSVRCTSDTVASAGVWRTREGYLEDVGNDTQSKETTWRIVVGDNEAVVSRVDGTLGATIQPEVWRVGR